MQQTDNYELNLPEGSDLVNLLTDYNPNFETIDAEMKGNSIASIGTATELKSGTVHAITRANPDAAMFRFVATADWVAGDTVTVDTVQVTALLPNGEALGSGSYVINSNVLCCLVGTLLTVFVPQGTISTADNALKLGGELPEYYGTASDVQTATNVANAASLLVNQLNSNLTQNDTLETTNKNTWGAINELLSYLTWKNCTVTNKVITIPQDCREISLLVYSGFNNIHFNNTISKKIIDTIPANERLMFGYGGLGVTYVTLVKNTNGNITVLNTVIDGNEYTSTATINAWYR